MARGPSNHLSLVGRTGPHRPEKQEASFVTIDERDNIEHFTCLEDAVGHINWLVGDANQAPGRVRLFKEVALRVLPKIIPILLVSVAILDLADDGLIDASIFPWLA